MRTDILQQIGIQEWRLRDDASHLVNPTQNKVESETSDALGIQANDLGLNLTDPDDIVDLTTVHHGESLENSPDEERYVQAYVWADLMAMLSNQKHCQSCGVSQPILGDGNTNAKWMFVFDSPSSRDIQQQQLLTGRVGQLFDAILLALNLKREDVYLTSIFKCPPASDISADKAQCDDIAYHQVKLVQPEVVVVFGEFSAQALIKTNDDLRQLRVNDQSCADLPSKVVPTYGLMEMLDKPMIKAQVWDDLKKAIQLIC